MKTSIAKTCLECGTLNRLLIITSGLTPSWRVGCSHCSAILFEARDKLPTRSTITQATDAPERTETVAHSAGDASRRRRGPSIIPPSRSLPRTGPLFARSTVSAGLLAACGVLAVLVVERDAAEWNEEEVDLVAAEAPGTSNHHARGSWAATHTNPTDELAIAFRYRVEAEMLLGKTGEVYPDPREGMMRLQLAATMDPEVAAEAEASLDLSHAKRREIQQRLRLMKHDPNGIDGVFGAATRAAITAWQEQAGLPATGFMSERALDLLMAETKDEYHARGVAKAARRDRHRRMLAVAPVPRPPSISSERCARLNSGVIAYGHNFRCDVKGLREQLGAVSRTLADLFGSSELSRSL